MTLLDDDRNPDPWTVTVSRITVGDYDGTPESPAALARLLADAARDELAGREALDEALREHVATALRSADPRRVSVALTHLDVSARAGAPVARTLLDEAYAAVGAPAWTEWAARDPDAAALLRAEVEGVADDVARRIVSGVCGAR
jgi:hypothetical protein